MALLARNTRLLVATVVVSSVAVGLPQATAAPGAPPGQQHLPTGAPPALYRTSILPTPPPCWQAGERFPKVSGTSRQMGNAWFWSGFEYDDHGAAGVKVDTSQATISSPPVGTFLYPSGAAHENGADIVGAAVALGATDSWWRVDWQTLVDPAVPLAIWAMDTDADPISGHASWPAGAMLSSPGAERWLVVGGESAYLIDGDGQQVAVGAVGGEVCIDMPSRSFVVRLPRVALPVSSSWRIRLASGLNDGTGSRLATVPYERGSLPGQPPVYDIGFRAHEQEHLLTPSGDPGWWRESGQAAALAKGDVSAFSAVVDWEALGVGVEQPEPAAAGWHNRWYTSSIEVGHGVRSSSRGAASDWEPNFLGRRQPYALYVPAVASAGTPLPLTILLHSNQTQHNQFAVWNPAFVQTMCEQRGSICVSPLGRGAHGWWANAAELDFWEVWREVSRSFPLDPSRTVLAGFSMGGYGTYRIGREHPDLFAAAVVLAGAPACSIRVLDGVEVSVAMGIRDCDLESDTTPLLENAGSLPWYVGAAGADELAPASSAVEQARLLDAAGHRYRFELYPALDHVRWAQTGTFAGAVAWLRSQPRLVATDPREIRYAWYAAHQNHTLGIGPSAVFWLSGLQANSKAPGSIAEIRAVSGMLPPERNLVTRTQGLSVHADGPAHWQELDAQHLGSPIASTPEITLSVAGVSAATLDLARAGFGKSPAGTVTVTSDGPVELILTGLKPKTTVSQPQGEDRIADKEGSVTVPVPAGHSRIRFGAAPRHASSR